MSRFCKFGKLHVTKGNVDKLLSLKFMVNLDYLFRSSYMSV